MTDDKKIKVMAEMDRLDEGVILSEFTQVRQTFRVILTHIKNEIMTWDKGNSDDEQKIDKLLELKELIENNIHSVTCMIIKLADILIHQELKDQDKRGNQ